MKINAEKVHIRHNMLYYFHYDKTTTQTTKITCEICGDNIVLKKTHDKIGLKKLKSSNFYVNAFW